MPRTSRMHPRLQEAAAEAGLGRMHRFYPVVYRSRDEMIRKLAILVGGAVVLTIAASFMGKVLSLMLFVDFIIAIVVVLLVIRLVRIWNELGEPSGVAVHDGGAAWFTGDVVEAFQWAEASFYQRLADVRVGTYRESVREYTFGRPGMLYTIGRVGFQMPGGDEATAVIRRSINGAAQERAIAELREGRRADFGPIAFDGRELTVRHRTVPWSDVKGVEVINGDLMVKARGALSAPSAHVRDIPNVDACVTLLQSMAQRGNGGGQRR